MKDSSDNLSQQKNELHPRNKHRSQYNFEELIKNCPELKQYVLVNQHQIETIDFTNPSAVKALNQALLKQFYYINFWDIPSNYLCPPIPGRVDYIHHIADVLAASNDGVIPKGKRITVLDIGVGANCIYPLLGNKEYGWNFIGSDIDIHSIKIANQIVVANGLSKMIDCRHQPNALKLFNGIIKEHEFIDITMSNPPFHSSAKEAQSVTERKWKNLGHQKSSALNFGGQQNELWCKGGELGFITHMIEESVEFKQRCLWFTTLVSKSENLKSIYFMLNKVGAVTVNTVSMSQGNKVSRLVAWTFLNEVERQQWSLKRF